MKSLLAVALAVSLCTSMLQGQMVLYEDFESYDVDMSIHLQGTDTTAAWGEVPRWYCQDNTSVLRDHGWSNVREFWGNQYLEMVGNNLYGQMSTVGTSMSMESMAITGEGTIYMRWAVNDTSEHVLCTNSLHPGWDYDSNALVEPGEIGADGWQEGYSGQGYQKMGALFIQGGNIPFGARDEAVGFCVDDPDIQLPIQTWMELWIQVDSVGDRTKYFVCRQGDTPVQAMSPGPDGLPNTADDTEWWAMRNQGYDNNGVDNLKWIVSNWGYDDEKPNTIYVDTIGINTSAMTLERVGPDMPGQRPIPPCGCDLNCDGDVDLDDSVILKNHFGLPDPEADVNGDGMVDLDDFMIMKQCFIGAAVR